MDAKKFTCQCCGKGILEDDPNAESRSGIRSGNKTCPICDFSALLSAIILGGENLAEDVENHRRYIKDAYKKAQAVIADLKPKFDAIEAADQ